MTNQITKTSQNCEMNATIDYIFLSDIDSKIFVVYNKSDNENIPKL